MNWNEHAIISNRFSLCTVFDTNKQCTNKQWFLIIFLPMSKKNGKLMKIFSHRRRNVGKRGGWVGSLVMRKNKKQQHQHLQLEQQRTIKQTFQSSKNINYIRLLLLLLFFLIHRNWKHHFQRKWKHRMKCMQAIFIWLAVYLLAYIKGKIINWSEVIVDLALKMNTMQNEMLARDGFFFSFKVIMLLMMMMLTVPWSQ